MKKSFNRRDFIKSLTAASLGTASIGISAIGSRRFVERNSIIQKINKRDYQLLPFGERGQMKMLFDRRQRPQSVYLNDKVHIVFNAGAEEGATALAPSKSKIVTYDPAAGGFSDIVTLTQGSGSSGHHYCPVIWADTNDYLGVLFGGDGRRAGVHLVSKKPGDIGTSRDDWKLAPRMAPRMSYPTFYRISGNRQLLYYRTGGHQDNWTYRISEDNGKTWVGPEKDVTDFLINSGMLWCSYQTKLPSKDGRYLHVAIIAYDDNRPTYNPRYNTEITPSHCKYNLYYVKIDLQTDDVLNFKGEKIDTPIGFYQANEEIRIWNTDWRTTGVPPDFTIDENGNPAFLHTLSAETLEEYNWWFVRLVDGEWEKTLITPSSHQWNGGHIHYNETNDTYHAYLIVGDKPDYISDKYPWIETQGYMDRHGGGSIDEWVSADKGKTWEKLQDLTPDPVQYPGWKFNNVQPVTRPDGSVVDGMLLFYGWKDPHKLECKAFLAVER